MKQINPPAPLRQALVFQLFEARQWKILKICTSLRIMDQCDFFTLHYTHAFKDAADNACDVQMQDMIVHVCIIPSITLSITPVHFVHSKLKL